MYPEDFILINAAGPIGVEAVEEHLDIAVVDSRCSR